MLNTSKRGPYGPKFKKKVLPGCLKNQPLTNLILRSMMVIHNKRIAVSNCPKNAQLYNLIQCNNCVELQLEKLLVPGMKKFLLKFFPRPSKNTFGFFEAKLQNRLTEQTHSFYFFLSCATHISLSLSVCLSFLYLFSTPHSISFFLFLSLTFSCSV